MKDRLKLPQQYDAILLQRDLRNLEATDWVDHFVRQHYEGAWSVLPLRAPAGAMHPIQMIYSNPTCTEFVDTPLLARCPYIQQVLAAFDCPLRAVRLMKLAAGSIIKPHTDHDLAAEFGHARLHIPIVTNPDVDFRLNGTRVVMREGECWYLRLSDTHEVANRGASDRVHLVVDALINPWLAEHLALAEQSAADAPGPSDTADAASDQPGPAPGEGWIPYTIGTDRVEPVVDWCYLGDAAFSDPFFTETLARAKRRRDRPPPQQTGIDALMDWQTARSGVAPTAFIFHASRCGSTLVGRLAAALPDTIVISEAPVIDDVLRSSVPETRRIGWLRAVLSALGQPRRGGERRLFVKFDAWHVTHLALVQAAFPGVPCVFLYREPAAVVASHVRIPGMHMIPGMLDPAMIGLERADVFQIEREDYAARVLGAIYAAAVPHAAAGRVTLINYRDLPQAACTHLLTWCEMDESIEIQDTLRQIVQFDAKEPSRPFDPATVAQPSPRAQDAAVRFVERPFADLESLRLRQSGLASTAPNR